jgi:thiamine monophosphate kinase
MFTISPENLKELVKVYYLHSTLGITTIGKMVVDKKYVYLKGKEEFELPKGFDHFSSNINL